MDDAGLTDLERELLELASLASIGGETTTSLDEEMLEVSPGRATVETTLRGLVDRGLMRTERATFMGAMKPRDGVHARSEAHLREAVDRTYEDDWWILTESGREAIGLPREGPKAHWMNPSSGPFRVPPPLAPWCAWRFRRGKEPLPAWYRRLTGHPAIGRERTRRQPQPPSPTLRLQARSLVRGGRPGVQPAGDRARDRV
jgi:hypothetical protein